MILRTIARAIVLAAALCAYAAQGGEVPAFPTDHGARLSAQQVSKMAAAALVKAGHSAAKFKAQPPRFEVEHTQWWVFFDQVGPSVAIDGDITVLVNDRTRKVCVHYTFSAGPCT